MYLKCLHFVHYMQTLFSSPERFKILDFVLSNPGKEFKVRETARELNLSPMAVSKTFKLLIKKKVFYEAGKVDLSNAVTRALKIFLNVNKLDSISLNKKIRSSVKSCISAGLYGSWANGTNNSDSDIDLWIKAKKKDEDSILKVRRFVRTKLGFEANVLLLNESDVEKLRENDFVFYCSLINSFVLFGDGID